MLSRGDAVVYKCRGVYKVEEVGKLDFSFVDGKKDYYTLQSIDNQRDKAYVPIDDDKNILFFSLIQSCWCTPSNCMTIRTSVVR